MAGVRFEVLGRTDVDDEDTQFLAIVDSLVDRDRTRQWKRLVDAKTQANEVVNCHFSGFASIMARADTSAPQYHIRTFFMAPDISAVTT